MPYPKFNRKRLQLKSLSERRHLIDFSHFFDLDDPVEPFPDERLKILAARIRQARERKASIILLMGAHLLRAGVSRYIIRLMEQGFLTHIAMNGAGPIHDFELALVGATTESVAEYIRDGQFGLWRETGQINDILQNGVQQGLGFGEAVGKALEEGSFPHKELSILAAGYRLKVPVTVHVGIGYDIIHEHPSCNGAVTGEASYDDFLTFTHSVSGLEEGVLLNFGSATMGPEVYLKALAMARNVAHQDERPIRHFTTAVFDLLALGEDLDDEPPSDDPRYYFRPFKTILVRTVQDGGESFYIRGDHRRTFPSLYREIQDFNEAQKTGRDSR